MAESDEVYKRMEETQERQTAEERQYKKMTETPVSKLIIMLSIPTTISMFVTNVYNMADTYFVGKLGTSACGAVGIVFGLMAIIQAFGFMFGHGAGSIISRRLGGKDVESASRFASTSFVCALAAGGMITLFGLLTVCSNMMFRSVGKNGWATFLAILRSGLCFIPAILILSRTLGLTSVEIAQTIADILSFFIALPFAIYYLRKIKEMSNRKEQLPSC